MTEFMDDRNTGQYVGQQKYENLFMYSFNPQIEEKILEIGNLLSSTLRLQNMGIASWNSLNREFLCNKIPTIRDFSDREVVFNFLKKINQTTSLST